MMFGVLVLTSLHVVLATMSLVSGLQVMGRLIQGQYASDLIPSYLATSIVATVTGFAFPANHIQSSHIIGLISLLSLAIALYARYGAWLRGAWGSLHVVALSISVFCLYTSALQQGVAKLPLLERLPPAVITHLFSSAIAALSILFVAMTALAVRGVRHAREMVAPGTADGRGLQLQSRHSRSQRCYSAAEDRRVLASRVTLASRTDRRSQKRQATLQVNDK